MKKTMKMLSIILVVAMMLTIGLSTVSMAGEGETADKTQLVGDLFNQNAEGTEGITNVGGQIVDMITTVAIIVAVIVLLVLGIKYMMGSAAEKAEYKKTMIPYLVGAVLVFGAAAIAKAIINISGSLTSGLS